MGKSDFERGALRRANASNVEGDSQEFIPKTLYSKEFILSRELRLMWQKVLDGQEGRRQES